MPDTRTQFIASTRSATPCDSCSGEDFHTHYDLYVGAKSVRLVLCRMCVRALPGIINKVARHA